MQYWGHGDAESKWTWSTQEEAAAWTIHILLYGDSVQAGKGGGPSNFALGSPRLQSSRPRTRKSPGLKLMSYVGEAKKILKQN